MWRIWLSGPSLYCGGYRKDQALKLKIPGRNSYPMNFAATRVGVDSVSQRFTEFSGNVVISLASPYLCMDRKSTLRAGSSGL
eukprot:865110-Rhodomonas_salina.1